MKKVGKKNNDTQMSIVLLEHCECVVNSYVFI